MQAEASRAASSSRPGQRAREVKRVLQQTSALAEPPKVIFDPAIWHQNPNTGSYVDITTGEIRPESDFQFPSAEVGALETRPSESLDTEDEEQLRCPECNQLLVDVPRGGKIWRVCPGRLSAEPTCDYYGP